VSLISVVEFPFANEAFFQVYCSSNFVNFNRYNCVVFNNIRVNTLGNNCLF
jgi:hypothetical protein